MIMSNIKRYTTLGIGHGINDCIAGYIIGSLFYHGYPVFQLGIYTLLYNVLAFGGQYVAARLIEKYYRPKLFLLLCFGLQVIALAGLAWSPEIAVLFSGIASALFHVTGGMEALHKDDRAMGIGIFASPGIIGLIGGGWMAWQHISFTIAGILLCLLFMAVIRLWYRPSSYMATYVQQQIAIEGHDVLMIVLITIISMRSFIWDVIQLIEKDNYEWLVVIAIAALCGKIAGRWLADKIGHKTYTLYALLLSIPFLTLFKKHLVALSIGVFLLQSTIAPTTIMVLQHIKQRPALAMAWSFGLSVFMAILLFYTPVIRYLCNNLSSCIILMASVIMLFWYNKAKMPRLQ
jgi:FSR family fosmidomycin resistance protein-like MFS transporter